MTLSIEDGTTLVVDAMTSIGHSKAEAQIIADHLIDCELRGLSFGGLARALSIAERIQSSTQPRNPIRVLHETPVSATIDGGGQVGYLVGDRVTEIAIAKAVSTGMAVVGAHHTWYTGMFSYYLEKITRAGFAGMIAGSGGNMVAPHGGTEGRFGTNPLAFGFPSKDMPVIWDIGTAGMMMGEVVLRQRLGQLLPEGTAFDKDGHATRSAAEALDGGAWTVWGGHKGSGLAMMVQLLGMMCGAAAMPGRLKDSGFFMLVINPAILSPGEDFSEKVAEYSEIIRATRPLDPEKPVRIPFERSFAERTKRIEDGTIDVLDPIFRALCELAGQANQFVARRSLTVSLTIGGPDVLVLLLEVALWNRSHPTKHLSAMQSELQSVDTVALLQRCAPTILPPSLSKHSWSAIQMSTGRQ